MHPIIEVFGLHLPAYGIIAILSLLTLAGLGIFILYKSDLPIYDGVVLGAYGVLGACVGSKAMYLLQHNIPLSLKTEEDLLRIMQSGGSACGGIFFGLLLSAIGAWIHKIDHQAYIRKVIYLLPLCHGMWKIGCHCAGCCYGIPYKGVGSITVIENSSASEGGAFFPVQIMEAVLLFLLFLYLLQEKNRSISTYIFLYSIIRFIVEFFRNVEIKNMLGVLSDIQCICVIVILFIIIKKYVKGKLHED